MKDIVIELTLGTCFVFFVLAILTLAILFGGEPDIAGVLECEKLKATTEQCIKFLGLDKEARTITTTETRSYTP